MTSTVRRCSRCGASVPTLVDVALAAAKAHRALDTMRLAVPDDLSRNVRLVASALACWAQLCPPSIPKGAA